MLRRHWRLRHGSRAAWLSALAFGRGRRPLAVLPTFAAARGGPSRHRGDRSTRPTSFPAHARGRQLQRLSIASLAAPGGRRLAVGPQCERVAFAAGRGLCLQATRGVFTTLPRTADRSPIQDARELTLEGSPVPDARGAGRPGRRDHGVRVGSRVWHVAVLDQDDPDRHVQRRDARRPEQFAVCGSGAALRRGSLLGVTFSRDSEMPSTRRWPPGARRSR